MTPTPLHRLAFSGAVLLVATTAATPRARADEAGDSRRGAQLFAEGKAAIDRKDFATACLKFADSLKVAPRPNVVFSLAQ